VAGVDISARQRGCVAALHCCPGSPNAPTTRELHAPARASGGELVEGLNKLPAQHRRWGRMQGFSTIVAPKWNAIKSVLEEGSPGSSKDSQMEPSRHDQR
jgi:hypothetical protein